MNIKCAKLVFSRGVSGSRNRLGRGIPFSIPFLVLSPGNYAVSV